MRCTLPTRHRAHLIKPGAIAAARTAALLTLGAGTGLVACGGGLPRPPVADVRASDYLEVPFAPRTPPVEIVPERPSKDAVWVDGAWEWTVDRYRWSGGAWVVPPAGARRSRWALVRRSVDGQLFFAPAVWRDAGGRALPEPTPVLPARTRLPREGEDGTP